MGDPIGLARDGRGISTFLSDHIFIATSMSDRVDRLIKHTQKQA
jgi:hypothetical protein